MYLVTDELGNTTGAYTRVIDACLSARRNLVESKFLKDSRDIKISAGPEQDITNAGYTLLGTFSKRAGRIIPSFKVIKHWRDQQTEAGTPCRLNDFWKAMDVCPKCHGDKGTFDFNIAEQDWVLVKDCPCCKGAGNYVEPKVTKMKLIVKDTVYNSDGVGSRLVDLDVEEGTGAACMKCYREIKEAYNPEISQFRIEEDGRIVAIQVHGEMLWLDNVPPPEYFYPHYKKRQDDNSEARKIAQRAKEAYVAGLEAGLPDQRESKLLARIASQVAAEQLVGTS